MSGTSVDGIDAALVEIDERDAVTDCRLVAFLCVPWPADWRAAILDACRSDAPAQRITVLNFRLGAAFAEAAKAVADAAGVELDSVTAIASHGQTVWHQPMPIAVAGKMTTGTLQIGEPSVIAA